MVNSVPPLPSNRKFGAFFTAVFLVLGVYAFWKDARLFATICILLTLLLCTVTAAAPTLLTPLNRLWFGFGLVLGKIVNPIVLGMIFFIVITPVAFVARAFGRDALRLRRWSIDSYWVSRVPPGPDPQTFKNQF